MRERWMRTPPSDGHVLLPYVPLLIDTGAHRVLIDTGAGPLAPTTGRLRESLGALGVEPETIGTVILSHGHPDHIGGVLDTEGRPAFPNARYVMSAAESRFWTDEQTLAKCARGELLGLGPLDELVGSSARKYLPPLAGRIELIEGSEQEIAPGIHAVLAPGHTPGHLAIIAASGGAQLLYLSDALLLPAQVAAPEWTLPFDLLPDEAVRTRRRLLERAASDKMLAASYH
jgi:glyoxylase-like metal-dependent hydrolase (beta-lactamase superfamily II)